MFGSSAATGLTFGKVISGITKTLGVANQIIPIYKEVKPMISNAKNMFSIVKEFGGLSKNANNNAMQNTSVIKNDISSNSNNPVFFQ